MTTETQVVRLEPTQTREAAQVLGRACHDDPYWSWVLPEESKRARVLPWFMEVWAKYCLRYDEAYTTAGRVDGAALWMPPGKYPASLVSMILAGFAIVPLRFGLGAYRRLMSSTDFVERLHDRDIPSPHWYLPTLGVDPPRQGQGVGSALLQPILARADADGLPCYLETEKEINVPFYNRHGFEVVVEEDVPKGGPHFWTMKREPKG